MARKSKYQSLVSTITEGVMVVDYERQTKVSKGSGKKYYSYRLWVTADGEHMVEISTQSWNKWSFIKRLEKVTTQWIYLGQDTQEERDEDGLTKRERKDLIRKYGYAGVYEYGRFIRADEYEEMKEQERQAKQAEREQQAELEREQEKIEELMYEAYYFKQRGKESFEKYFTTDFKNINVYGSIMWETAEERIKWVNELQERNNNDNDILDIIYVNEWRTEYKAKFEAFIHNNWDKIWANTKKQWNEYQNEMKGEGWEERWQQQNEYIYDTDANEFDAEFEGCKTIKDVKQVYRRLAKANHSDVGGNDEVMAKINGAYDRASRKVDRAIKASTTLQDMFDEFDHELWEEAVAEGTCTYSYETWVAVGEYYTNPTYLCA